MIVANTDYIIKNDDTCQLNHVNNLKYHVNVKFRSYGIAKGDKNLLLDFNLYWSYDSLRDIAVSRIREHYMDMDKPEHNVYIYNEKQIDP
jgi:hypothetical protein